MKVAKTLRRKGVHTMPIPKPKKIGNTIQKAKFPSMPKLKMPKLKSRY